MKSPVLAATPLLAATSWGIALIIDSGTYESGAVLLIGIGLLLTAAISVVGMVVAGGRWARRLAIGVVAATGMVALVRPLDWFWLAALATSALAGVSLFLPAVTSRVRSMPAAAGPPQRAVLLTLILMSAPFVIAMTVRGPTGWPVLAVGLTAPLAGFAYSRVLPGGLLSVRAVWPVLALALALPSGSPTGLVGGVLGLVVALLAWHPSIKTAFHPPREVGTTFSIPPELSPTEILDAANLDDRGRPR